MRRTVFAFAVLAAGSAQAATISVQDAGPHDRALIVVRGTFATGDGERFFAKIAPLSTAIVRLEGSGGSVLAGIQIGETIRLKNMDTLVPAGARCASACALAWLGGSQRFMGPGARIGVHSAADPKSGGVSGVGNALLGAYLNRLGLSYSAVVYIVQAPPDSVMWLSIADAKRLGIDVTLLSSTSEQFASPGMRVGAHSARSPSRPQQLGQPAPGTR